MREQVVQQQQAGQQQQEATEATTAAVRGVWERLERLKWESGIWCREFIFLSDLKKVFGEIGAGARDTARPLREGPVSTTGRTTATATIGWGTESNVFA